jgi:hypothetical protein
MLAPRIFVPGLLTLSCLAACSGSGSSGSSVPTGIDNPTQEYVVQKMGPLFAAISRTGLLVPVLLLPPLRAGAGITFELDTDIGAAPNTYDYSIPLDGNGDGVPETTIAGKAVFSADPTVIENLVAGFEASADVDLTTTIGTFEGTVELGFGADGALLVSGNGTFDDTVAVAGVQIAVDALDPLKVRTSSDESDEMPNACTWSLDGDVAIEASNADGQYGAVWQFAPTSTLIHVTDASFQPTGGAMQTLSDSQFEAGPCPANGAFDDWAGAFQFDWFCAPPDEGDSTLTITVIDGDTIEVFDEDITYQAERDANNPHVVHGSFVDTDGGGTYEEFFTWVMAADGQTFKQFSEYSYFSGPAAGFGGFCGGTGTRN